MLAQLLPLGAGFLVVICDEKVVFVSLVALPFLGGVLPKCGEVPPHEIVPFALFAGRLERARMAPFPCILGE
jgi:hypothetical protein